MNNMALTTKSCVWNEVLFATINDNGQFAAKFNYTVSVSIERAGDGAKITVMKGKSSEND